MSEPAPQSSNREQRPTGPEVIARALRDLDNSPGVYRMLGRDGKALYVGKARSLKKRVAAYVKMGGHTNRIARMISETAAMEFVTTETETEALLLESNLIKRLRPRYNILLRDDKSFPFILVREAHPFPQIVKHRGARAEKGAYFGPFASAGAVNRTLTALQKSFLLRACSDSVFENRTRPCLLYQIRRCSAPCVDLIDELRYGDLVRDAMRFLRGESRDMQAALASRMEAAAEALDFEQAAIYRDRIRALTHVQGGQNINPEGLEEADVFALHQEGGQSCVQVFFFRAGQNWGNRAYFPRHDRADAAEAVLTAFIGQFYDNKPCPRLILASHEPAEAELLAEALSLRAERRVAIRAPKRGEKRALVDHAAQNAREALARKLAESASQAKLLTGLAEAFDLDQPPARIEIYDNSHIQGANPIGAMVAAGPEGFLKSQYRKFNIKSKEAAGDDFAMMREVMTRRFTRLMKEAPEREAGVWPDLLLIDGGAGQVSAVTGALAELGLEDVAVIGVSKGPERDAGRERFHIPGRPAFSLEAKSPVLYFVQRLRDEAHRFAIGAHRKRRAKAAAASPLDEIAGVGPARKRALLHHFGSAKAVSRAKLTDLEAAPGISKTVAKKVFDHFHDS